MDYLHAVVEADRTFDTIHVVERMQKDGVPPSREDWRARHRVLPLPAQFLMESGDLAAKTGTDVRYGLISLWPINPQHGPYNAAERNGLERVLQRPEQPATATVRTGTATTSKPSMRIVQSARLMWVVTKAIHATRKRHFETQGVMGGLVIEIHLSK